ncbi:MAG: acyloxyacyl hydrolase [Verrucomicrobiales bacterium]|nr:acyloxyacyl hydrolase [Verrucomicrobiales bacterium]
MHAASTTWKTRLSTLLLLALSAWPFASTSRAAEASEPFDHWEASFSTGALWSIGSNASPLNYTLLPQFLEAKTPPMFHIPAGASEWVVRSRFTFEGAPIVKGPESYFIGMLFSPSIEFWPESRRWSWFISSGGGFGVMDSRGYDVPGGQGQDFNLSWFAQSGVRVNLTDGLSLTAAALFQHISNGGQNDVNPGIDSLGFTLGVAWNF